MLKDVRVLEISAPYTMLAGQILGDLGADVVTLEAPGGAPGRRIGPFIDNIPGLERSLTWHALNRNKRGLTLDIAHHDGKAILADLLQHFDIVIEYNSENCSSLGTLQLGSPVVCRIEPFGKATAKSAYRVTDMILTAAGGAPAMAGNPDRAPLFFPVPQAMFETGAEAAIAALAGLALRDRTGLGQLATVNGQVATMLATLGRLVAGRSGGPLGSRHTSPPAGLLPTAPEMYECADGWAAITVIFLPGFVAMTQRIAEWLAEEGSLDPAIAQLDFLALGKELKDGSGDPAPILRLYQALTDTCAAKTKSEVIEISRKYRFIAAPAMDMSDISSFQHYEERGLFVKQDIGGKSVEVPARFAQFNNYSIEVSRPAPSLSQHSFELLNSLLGFSECEVQALFSQGII
jgi:benzylsuccinate CoA-transferase BbsE subunit